jgi:RNA polymerase sigma factor (sigma-70 family)
MNADIEAALCAAHSGEINFDTFVRRTKSKWHAIAKEFYRSWILPAWVAFDDVLQELLLAVWTAINDYDPSRSGPAYFAWLLPQEIIAAQKAAAIARFVEWRSRKALSRAMAKFQGLTLHRPAQAIAWFRVEQVVDSESPTLLNAAEEPDQERAIDEPRERARKFAIMKALAETPRQLAALRLIDENGSVEEAARVINADLDSRIAFRVSTLEEARLALQTSIAGLQRKFGIEEEATA